MQLLIRPDGGVRCVYDEAINLSALGRVQIRRASHVEPNDDGRWFADMAPCDGPRLGPFERRSDALAAERLWLRVNWLVPDPTR
jgi:hypothetical protein